jgi:energy-converting hydrogenase Eha subunit E
VHKGAFARGMNFIFISNCFFVDWRSKVVDNVKCLSIGLLNVYVCFVIKSEQALFQHIGGLLSFVKVNFVVTLWLIRLSFVIACYKFVVAH